MTHFPHEVKEDCPTPRYSPRWVRFVDRHPRIGWYVCGLLTINYLIDLLQIIH
jgi:hypothetical protein